MSPIVEVEAVRKRFGTVDVLEGVSFQIRAGSVVAIVGRSGSGKSTALRCINRLETIDAGRIRVCGQDVTSRQLDVNRLHRDVGIVFQSYNLFPHLTAEENVTLAPRLVLKLPRAAQRGWPSVCWRRWAWPRRRSPIRRNLGRPAAARRDCPLIGDDAQADAVRRDHVRARSRADRRGAEGH
jgi:ABC-type sugar transport system ATPase subunit